MSNNTDKTNNTEKLFENKIWLNVSEASAYTGIPKSTLYKHDQFGIPCYSSTGKKGGRIRFKKEDLDLWWDERRIS
jgi:excisionase family DNA binding protein